MEREGADEFPLLLIGLLFNRILGNQLMLHNKNETRSAALAVRFLLSVLVFFAETFAKALYFNSLKTSILWLSELDL